MKQPYKFKVDEPPLAPERIDSHKDFSKVLSDYHNLTQPLYKRPLYKNPKAFAGLMLILSMAALVYIAVEEEDAAAKKPDTDSVTVQERVVLAPTFAQATAPTAINAPPSQKIQIQGVRGDFDFAPLGQPAKVTTYATAADLVTAGVPSLNSDDHGLDVEEILKVEVTAADQLPSFTWSQVRQEGMPMVMSMWDEQSRRWVEITNVQRDKLNLPQQDDQPIGDDGFKAIEYNSATVAGQEVKAASAHEKAPQERFTWTLAANRLYRLAHRVPESNVTTLGSLKPTDAALTPLVLQRMLLVYENGNVQQMEMRKGIWKSHLFEGMIAAYGFTPDGRLAFAPAGTLTMDAEPTVFTLWEGQPDSPDALLQKLFGASK